MEQSDKAAIFAAATWERARQVRGLSQAARWLPSWPDVFDVYDIARLQYPWEGTKDERSRAHKEQDALVAGLKRAIESGSIQAGAVAHEWPSGLRRRPGGGVHRRGDAQPVKPLLEWLPDTCEVPTLDRSALAMYLDAAGLEPSGHIRAWFGDLWPVASPDATMAEEEAKPASTEHPPIPLSKARTGAGRLAEEAAWEIECETGQPADAKNVLRRLQGWADKGEYPDVLIKRLPSAVQWLAKGKHKEYDINACRATLNRWYAARQKNTR